MKLNKCAKDNAFTNLATTLNPFASITGSIKTNRLPTIFKDERHDKLFYNTLGSIVSVGGLSAVAAVVANRLRRRKWEAKKDEIAKSSVNSLYPSEELKASAENQETEKLDKKASVGDTVSKIVYGALPITAGLTAGIFMPKLLMKTEEGKYKDELDKEIAAKYDKLNKLHARAVELGLSKKANTLTDVASGALGGALALGGPIAAHAFYKYLKKTDKNEKIVEAMEDLAAENLTNIPQRISLKLSTKGTPAKADKEPKKVENKEEPKKVENKEEPKKDVDAAVSAQKSEKDELFS